MITRTMPTIKGNAAVNLSLCKSVIILKWTCYSCSSSLCFYQQQWSIRQSCLLLVCHSIDRVDRHQLGLSCCCLPYPWHHSPTDAATGTIDDKKFDATRRAHQWCDVTDYDSTWQSKMRFNLTIYCIDRTIKNLIWRNATINDKTWHETFWFDATWQSNILLCIHCVPGLVQSISNLSIIWRDVMWLAYSSTATKTQQPITQYFHLTQGNK